MHKSKTILIIHNLSALILSSLTVLTVGCNLPSSTPRVQSDNSLGSSFVVVHQEASFTSVKSDASLSLPISKTLSLKICLRDIQYGKEIINHKFIIQSDSQSNEASTDQSGCLIWKENVEYNHVANSKNIEFKRTLVAKGFQKGSRVISFAINPWEDKVTSLKDNKVENLIAYENAQISLQGKNEINHLRLSNVSANITQKTLSTHRSLYSIEFTAEPKFVTKDISNQNSQHTITTGQYELQFYIFKTRLNAKGKIRELIAQPEAVIVDKLQYGKIAKTFDAALPGGCSLSNYELGIIAKPLKTQIELKPAEVVYDLGPCESIIGTKSPRYISELQEDIESGKLSIADYAEKSIKTLSPFSHTHSGKLSEGVTSASIVIGPVTPIFPITYSQINAYQKEKHFKLRFCVNTTDGRPVRNHKFKVTGVNGKSNEYETNNEGCIVSAADSFPFNYFSKECWKRRNVIIESESLGIYENVPVAVNTVYDFGNFVRDLRQDTNDVTNQECAQGDSKIIADNYEIDKVRYDYEINPYLGLTVHKKGILRVPLRLHRPSLTTAVTENLALPSGKYLLRWAVVDNNVTDYTKAAGKIYAAGMNEFTTNSNSMIQIDDFDIPITNLKAIGSTNTLLLEVTPVGVELDSSSIKLKTVPLRSTILVQNNRESGTIVPKSEISPVIENLINQFKIDQSRIIAEEKAISSKQSFAKLTNIELINLNDSTSNKLLSILKLNADDLKSWIKSGQITSQIATRFCQHWISDVIKLEKNHIVLLRDSILALKRDCYDAVSEDPRKYFDIEYRYFVENAQKIENMNFPTRDLSLSQGYFMSKGHSFSDSQSIGADIGGSLSAKDSLGPLSASVGAKYSFFNYSWSQSTSHGNTNTSSQGLSATIETVGIKARADSFEKCAVIRLNPSQAFDTEEKMYKKKSFSNFIHKTFQLDGLKGIISDLSEVEKYNILNRGYIICTGEKQNKPINFTEMYYVVNQKAQITQITDNSAENTRQFYIDLRSREDLVAYISKVQGDIGFPDEFLPDYQQTHLLYENKKPIFNGFRSFPGQIVAPQ